MKNEELIKALRHCGEDVVAECNDCPLFGACDSLEYPLLHAADALEAAEKRIAELEAQMPKEGEWISGYDGFEWEVRCSVCGEEALIKEGGSNDHAYSNYCPNCGAKMDGKEQNDE